MAKTKFDLTIPNIVARWTNPETRPRFVGELVARNDVLDADGNWVSGDICRCAQGDILHLAGWSDDRLQNVEQDEADRAVASKLGITLIQAVLIRLVNDGEDKCPEEALANVARFFGPQTPRVLAFAKRLDRMTAAAWKKVIRSKGHGPWFESASSLGNFINDMVKYSPGAPAVRAWDAATGARWEAKDKVPFFYQNLPGYDLPEVLAIMEIYLPEPPADGYFFLPLFGFPTPAALDA